MVMKYALVLLVVALAGCSVYSQPGDTLQTVIDNEGQPSWTSEPTANGEITLGWEDRGVTYKRAWFEGRLEQELGNVKIWVPVLKRIKYEHRHLKTP